MSVWDIVVLAGFVFILIFVGLGGHSRPKTAENFFLADRKLTWWQVGFSLFATNFSASAIVGMTGAAYLTGIAIYNYEWTGVVAMIIFALFLVGAVRSSRVFTISQYLAERYDPRIKYIYSAFIVILIVFIDMAGSLYAGGLLLQEIFPALSLRVIILGIMVIAGLYTVLGGMKAIARTDVFQSIVLIIGALLVSYYTYRAGGGWENIKAHAAPEALSLIRPLDDRVVPWPALLTGIPVLCAYFWMVNQNMVQWVLSAKSGEAARRGLLMAGYLKLLILFIIVIPGVIAAQLLPGLEAGDKIYPALLSHYLPVGVLGVVLAGFVAALLSNTDSTLHAASTIITMDIFQSLRPNLSTSELVAIGRIATGTIILLSALWAPWIGSFGTLFEYVQGTLSYAVAPFVVVYLAGWFWPKANAQGAFWALILGLGSAAIFAILQAANVMDLHYLYIPIPLTLISLAALILISRRGTAPQPADRLLWHPASVSRTDKIITAILIVLIMLQLYFFW